MSTVSVWVIVLLNFFHQSQGVLPGNYPTLNDCKLAIVQQGYADINILGVHGECMPISGSVVKH
jgi:hypothetical protein